MFSMFHTKCFFAFQFRRPFDSSHRCLWFVNLNEDRIKWKPAYTQAQWHRFKSRSNVISTEHSIHGAVCAMPNHKPSSSVQHSTQTHEVCVRESETQMNVRRAHTTILARHVIRLSVSSFYVVRFVYMSNEFFDSGEFILKLNASLNSSLCKSTQALFGTQPKRAYIDIRRKKAEQKKNRKKKSKRQEDVKNNRVYIYCFRLSFSCERVCFFFRFVCSWVANSVNFSD